MASDDRIAELEARIGKLEAENARLAAENAQLRRIAVEPRPRLRIGLAVPVGLALLAMLAVILNVLRDCKG